MYTPMFTHSLTRTLFFNLSHIANELLQTKQKNSLLPSISILTSSPIKLLTLWFFEHVPKRECVGEQEERNFKFDHSKALLMCCHLQPCYNRKNKCRQLHFERESK